jgi:hypothetical protein
MQKRRIFPKDEITYQQLLKLKKDIEKEKKKEKILQLFFHTL